MLIHVDSGGQRLGTYSLEDVNRYLADGTLLPTDKGWHEGASDWLPLKQIAGVKAGDVAPSASKKKKKATVRISLPPVQDNNQTIRIVVPTHEDITDEAKRLKSGTVLWEFKTGSMVYSSPAIGADGTVYVGSSDKKVYALDGKTGAKKWDFKTGDKVDSSPAIGADGTVYVGSSDNKVYALDGRTGEKKWEFETGREVESSPAIGTDGTVYIGSSDKKVYALDGKTGAKKWEFKTGDQVDSSPAIGADGTVYVGSSDKKVYALDGKTGAKKWDFKTGGYVHSPPAIGANFTVYVGSFDKKVYALDAKTGAKKWELKTGGSVISSPAIGADGTVYFGSFDKKIYALNGKNGAKKWEFSTGDMILSSPAVGEDGTVYIGSMDKKVHALNGATGIKKWEFSTEDGVPVSSPAIGTDGIVYVGSNDKKIYAFACNSKSPAKSLWPMRGQNPQHTGCVRPLRSLSNVSDKATEVAATAPTAPRTGHARKTLAKIVAVVALLAGLGAGGWFLYPTEDYPSNKLFAEATELIARAQDSEDHDISVAITDYDKALEKIHRIVNEYPESDMAVKLESNEALIWGHSLAQVELLVAGLKRMAKEQQEARAQRRATIQRMAKAQLKADEKAAAEIDNRYPLGSKGNSPDKAAADEKATADEAAAEKAAADEAQRKADEKAAAEKATIWKFEAEDVISATKIGADGTVYIEGKEKIYALDGKTGRKKWDFALGSSGGSTLTIGADDDVYIWTRSVWDHKIYAVDGKTGRKKWEFAGGRVSTRNLTFTFTASGKNGIVYIGKGREGGSLGQNNSLLYALDGTGAELWKKETDHWGWAYSPVIGPNGTVYVDRNDGGIAECYAFDGKTGTKKWEFRAGRESFSGPSGINAVIGIDGTVYVRGKTVYALDGKTGTKLWEYAGSLPTIGIDGTVYAKSSDSKEIHAKDGKTGAPKWKFEAASGIGIPDNKVTAINIGADGTIYVVLENKGDSIDSILETLPPSPIPMLPPLQTGIVLGNKLWALDGKTGAKKWDFEMGRNKFISIAGTGTSFVPVIADGADGTVYVGGEGKIYVLDDKTGAKKREFVTARKADWKAGVVGIPSLNPNPVTETSSVVVGKDGTIIVSTGKKIFALNGKSDAGVTSNPPPDKGSSPTPPLPTPPLPTPPVP
ncbi:MAG: PQQ-binding-like beta-propeller repeat protein [Verrucomicrobiota bacterium]|nr:PQQ-binding-like beta-propeller repeat protein [Verrucomicrobiota bacterium]